MEAVAGIPFDERVDGLDEQGRHRFPDPQENARRLQRVARDSYPLAEALQPAINLVLSLSLKTISHLEALLKRLDTAIAEQMGQIPNTLTPIPGIGPVFAAGILAEIGGVERFGSDETTPAPWTAVLPAPVPQAQVGRLVGGAREVAKYAGFKWRKSGSAEFQAEETPLTRTGNPYLSYYFCEAAFSVHRCDSQYQAYYQRKFKEARTHRHKRALVLTARKLVRLVVRLLATNQPYQPRSV